MLETEKHFSINEIWKANYRTVQKEKSPPELSHCYNLGEKYSVLNYGSGVVMARSGQVQQITGWTRQIKESQEIQHSGVIWALMSCFC